MSLFQMVPEAGFEPARPPSRAGDFKSPVSTCSTTRACLKTANPPPRYLGLGQQRTVGNRPKSISRLGLPLLPDLGLTTTLDVKETLLRLLLVLPEFLLVGHRPIAPLLASATAVVPATVIAATVIAR